MRVYFSIKVKGRILLFNYSELPVTFSWTVFLKLVILCRLLLTRCAQDCKYLLCVNFTSTSSSRCFNSFVEKKNTTMVVVPPSITSPSSVRSKKWGSIKATTQISNILHTAEHIEKAFGQDGLLIPNFHIDKGHKA